MDINFNKNWKTKELMDIWLYHKSNNPDVRNNIQTQYTKKWIGFQLNPITFIQPTLLCIYTKNGNIVLNSNKLLVYGTTLFLKVFHEILEQNSNKILISLFGEELEINNNHIIYNNKKYENTILDITNILQYPQIKYSFNLLDINEYDNDEIFISSDTEIIKLTDIQLGDKKNIQKYISLLPKYITKYIK